MAPQLRTNQDGVALIKEMEGCALTAYQDSGGVWTIGWGRTKGVKAGDCCSQDEADAWLCEDISAVETHLAKILLPVVLGDDQFSALVSFCYNVGFGLKGVKDGFQVLKDGNPSTMYRLINQGNLAGAADEFPKWNHIAGKVSAGITRRRAMERALFLSQEGVSDGYSGSPT